VQRIARFVISTAHFGDLKVLRPIPLPDEPWGPLAPLRGTPWGDLIPTVSGENLSHALHGHAKPLMEEIGPEPRTLLRRIQDPHRDCSLSKACLTRGDYCFPHPKVPECYLPPNLESPATLVAAVVALAWAEGRYVLIAEGAEFSL